MAKKSLLTYNAKVSSVEQAYFFPSAVLPYATSINLGTVYCFLASTLPWADDNDPPVPTQDQKYIKQVFKNIFATKRITSGDISPVVERINWTTGTVYDYYQDDVDMLNRDENGLLYKKFYVKNRYDQVFKCLWNNNGGTVSDEPYFEPGTYSTNNIYTGSDGYKWKYMYTIDTGLKVKFMDAEWIPIPIGANTPNPETTSAGAGSIDVVNVLNGGSGYDAANSVIKVTILGDGSNAEATLSSSQIVNGVITDISITNPGKNYTYANVVITGTAANGSSMGAGAVAISPTSPVGGHAFDPVSELGCAHVMFSVEFIRDEGGKIPTDNNYYQIGLIINPTTKDQPSIPANSSVYRTTTNMVVAPGFGTYSDDEFVFQTPTPGGSIDAATFKATVLSFDTATNTVKLINMVGTPVLNAPLYGNSSGTTRTLLSVDAPTYSLLSGYMTYIENRSGVQRSPDGIEQYKFVLGY
jgi:hypothetical protein